MGVYGKPRRRRVWLGGVIVWFNYNHLNPPGVALLHAEVRGLPVLKENVSWRNFNGFVIRTPRSQTFLHFWRLPWIYRADS